MSVPRIVISAPRGGAGKTVAALGIARALQRRGLRVAPFKKGPDYIDARWLSKAAGAECTNLDPFLMEPEVILEAFGRRARAADIALIEGNRGLYDGVDEAGGSSTAALASLLKAPVLVVLDCTKTTRTAAALLLGLKVFDPEVKIAGVVLNHVARARHEAIVRRAVETYTGIPVLGVVPRMKKDPIPMRHLGVLPLEEHPEAEAALEALAAVMEKGLDLHRILEEAARAGTLSVPSHPAAEPLSWGEEIRAGILRDRAFQFYYPENLEALEQAGARLVFIDALRDTRLPDVDLLYIGGGFPETQAEELSRNRLLMEEISSRVEEGLPVYAECGGLMYLGASIRWREREFPMAGVFDWRFVVGKRPVGHGYTVLEAEEPTPFFEAGARIAGHEFHYSRPEPLEGPGGRGRLVCKVIRGHGFGGGADGLLYKNAFGTYTHVHALESRDWGLRLVRAGASWRRERAGAALPPGAERPEPGVDKKSAHRL